MTENNIISIKDTIHNFLINSKEINDDIYYVDIEELIKYSIIKRNKQNSRNGSILKCYDSRKIKQFKQKFPEHYLNGQDKWEKLREELKNKGWIEECPAIIMIRHVGKCRLWDGHHRLYIAKELGIDHIPVKFIFRHNKRNENQEIIYGKCKNHFGNLWAFANRICLLGNKAKDKKIKVSNYIHGADIIKEIISLLDVDLSNIEWVDKNNTETGLRYGVKKFKLPYYSTKIKWKQKYYGRIVYQLETGSSLFDQKKITDVNIFLDKIKDRFNCDFIKLGKHFSIQECIENASTSDLFIGICSGMSHLCHSVGVPVFLYNWDKIKKCHPNKDYKVFNNADDAIELINKQIIANKIGE